MYFYNLATASKCYLILYSHYFAFRMYILLVIERVSSLIQ